MNSFQTEIIYRRAIITLKKYTDKRGVNILINAASEMLQKLYADQSFGPSELQCFSAILVNTEEMAFWLSQFYLLSYLNIWINDKWFKNFAVMRYFERIHFIDNIDLVLIFPYLRWAKGNECNHAVVTNLQGEVNIHE